MRFQTPLEPATLLRRYKRFLADIRLADGREVIAHCANPGSMMGLAEPGTKIWVEPNDDPKKKLKFGWRLVDHENGHFTGVDTSLPNKALKAALTGRTIPELAAYDTVLPEQVYGEKSRIDFLLRAAGLPDAYVEVKSVTLMRQSGLAEFPDSVTARGAKHLAELSQMAAQGHRTVLFYFVQRTDCTGQLRMFSTRTDCSAVTVAADIDLAYARALQDAAASGVEILVYDTHITPSSVEIGKKLPVRDPQTLALSPFSP